MKNEFKVLYLEEELFYSTYQILRFTDLEFAEQSRIVGNANEVLAGVDLYKQDGYLWARVHDMTPFAKYLESNIKFWFAPQGKIREKHEEIREHGKRYEVITKASLEELLLYAGEPWPDCYTPSIADQILENSLEEVLLNETHSDV